MLMIQKNSPADTVYAMMNAFSQAIMPICYAALRFILIGVSNLSDLIILCDLLR